MLSVMHSLNFGLSKQTVVGQSDESMLFGYTRQSCNAGGYKSKSLDSGSSENNRRRRYLQASSNSSSSNGNDTTTTNQPTSTKTTSNFLVNIPATAAESAFGNQVRSAINISAFITTPPVNETALALGILTEESIADTLGDYPLRLSVTDTASGNYNISSELVMAKPLQLNIGNLLCSSDGDSKDDTGTVAYVTLASNTETSNNQYVSPANNPKSMQMLMNSMLVNVSCEPNRVWSDNLRKLIPIPYKVNATAFYDYGRRNATVVVECNGDFKGYQLLTTTVEKTPVCSHDMTKTDIIGDKSMIFNETYAKENGIGYYRRDDTTFGNLAYYSSNPGACEVVEWDDERTICKCDLCKAVHTTTSATETTTTTDSSSSSRRKLSDINRHLQVSSDAVLEESGIVELNAMTSYVFGTFVSAQQKFEEFDDLQTFLDAYIVLVLFGICYIFAAGAFVFALSNIPYKKIATSIVDKKKNDKKDDSIIRSSSSDSKWQKSGDKSSRTFMSVAPAPEPLRDDIHIDEDGDDDDDEGIQGHPKPNPSRDDDWNVESDTPYPLSWNNTNKISPVPIKDNNNNPSSNALVISDSPSVIKNNNNYEEDIINENVTNPSNLNSDSTVYEDTESALTTYLFKLFPGVYAERQESIQRLFGEIFTGHIVLKIFASEDRWEALVSTLELLTTLAANFLILAMLTDLEFPDDSGQCASKTTTIDCLALKSTFDPALPLCNAIVHNVTVYDQYGFASFHDSFECSMADPEVGPKLFIIMLLLATMIVVPINISIVYIFDGILRAPTVSYENSLLKYFLFGMEKVRLHMYKHFIPNRFKKKKPNERGTKIQDINNIKNNNIINQELSSKVSPDLNPNTTTTTTTITTSDNNGDKNQPIKNNNSSISEAELDNIINNLDNMDMNENEMMAAIEAFEKDMANNDEDANFDDVSDALYEYVDGERDRQSEFYLSADHDFDEDGNILPKKNADKNHHQEADRKEKQIKDAEKMKPSRFNTRGSVLWKNLSSYGTATARIPQRAIQSSASSVVSAGSLVGGRLSRIISNRRARIRKSYNYRSKANKHLLDPHLIIAADVIETRGRAVELLKAQVDSSQTQNKLKSKSIDKVNIDDGDDDIEIRDATITSNIGNDSESKFKGVATSLVAFKKLSKSLKQHEEIKTKSQVIQSALEHAGDDAILYNTSIDVSRHNRRNPLDKALFTKPSVWSRLKSAIGMSSMRSSLDGRRRVKEGIHEDYSYRSKNKEMNKKNNKSRRERLKRSKSFQTNARSGYNNKKTHRFIDWMLDFGVGSSDMGQDIWKLSADAETNASDAAQHELRKEKLENKQHTRHSGMTMVEAHDHYYDKTKTRDVSGGDINDHHL